MPDDTATRVRKIIAAHFVAGTVTDDEHLVNDLGADSLDPIELTIEIEDALNVDLTDDDHAKWATVGDVIKAVEAHLAERSSVEAMAAFSH